MNLFIKYQPTKILLNENTPKTLLIKNQIHKIHPLQKTLLTKNKKSTNKNPKLTQFHKTLKFLSISQDLKIIFSSTTNSIP